MKPKRGSQPRTPCAIPTFGHWDRWCTNYLTVRIVSIVCLALRLFCASCSRRVRYGGHWIDLVLCPMFPTRLITSFIGFDCSRLDFHVPGHSADERSGLPTSRSRTTFENTSPIHVTLKMRKQTNVWAQANTRTRRKRIPRRDGLNEREDKYIITIITVRESTFRIKM